MLSVSRALHWCHNLCEAIMINLYTAQNADPDVRVDMETFLNHVVPEVSCLQTILLYK